MGSEMCIRDRCNIFLNAGILSLSFLNGVLLSFINKSELLISTSFLINLLMTSLMITLTNISSNPSNQDISNFIFSIEKNNFIYPTLFFFNISATFSYFTIIRTIDSNFKKELNSYLKITILISTLIGFSIAAFSISISKQYNISELWTVFVIGFLALLMSFFFRFKSTENFSRIQSPT